VATPLASAAQILELYRMRWEIELVFKRLKSLFHDNEIPWKLEGTARAWFYGKLLLASICEAVVNSGRFPPCGEQNTRERMESLEGTGNKPRAGEYAGTGSAGHGKDDEKSP
jgi:hypothetical protein